MRTENFHLTLRNRSRSTWSRSRRPGTAVLDSRVQRQFDHEIVAEGEPNPETEFRRYELDEEFENRDNR